MATKALIIKALENWLEDHQGENLLLKFQAVQELYDVLTGEKMKTNYVFAKYDFPLPNNGDRYNLSQDELVELLDNAYNCGFEHARDAYDPSRQGTVTWASTKDIDDSTKWKEVRIK